MVEQDKYNEWFLQSDYDPETAEVMLNSGRYIYAVFMCHLSLEKAVKGVYVKRKNINPAKSHDLLYFIEKSEIMLSDEDREFMGVLNRVSVPTRYPEDLQKMISVDSPERTKTIMEQTKSLQQWIKQQ
jgi:HEPN domain-containing protein